MDEKKQALLAFCQEQEDGENLTIHDIVKSEYDDNVYETPVGEFSILTDREADDAFKTAVEGFIDDVGIEGFSEDFQEYIYNNCIDESSKEFLLDEIKELATSYMEDISYESGNETNTLTRQQEEIIEFLYENTNEINFTLDEVKEYEEYCDERPEYAEEISDFLENYNDDVSEYLDKYLEYSKETIAECEEILKDKGNDLTEIETKFVEYGKELMAEYEDFSAKKGNEDELTAEQNEKIIECLYEEGIIEFGNDDINKFKEYENKAPEHADEIAEFLERYDDNSYRYIEMYAEDYANDYKNNPIEYFQENFGYEETKEMIKENKNITFDTDAIARDVELSDGRGNMLASYDGNECEQSFEGETFYIYQQNSTIIDKVADMIDTILDDNSEVFENITAYDIIDLLDEGKITRETLENADVDEILENIDNNKNIDITD